MREIYSYMDLDIGRHCDYETCHRLDFLPTKCGKCGKRFCQEHEAASNHECIGLHKETPKAVRPRSVSPPKQGIKCANPVCSTLLNDSTSPPTACKQCGGKLYCLKHRHPADHPCLNIVPTNTAHVSESRDKLLMRLREWAGSRQIKGMPKTSGPLLGLIKAKAPKYNKTAELVKLKKAAKGDTKVEESKRIYVYGEAPPRSLDNLSAGHGVQKEVFFSSSATNGRVLDQLSQLMGEINVNNRTDDASRRLHLFHVESGSLLEPSRLFGEHVQNGHSIVLIRGLILSK